MSEQNFQNIMVIVQRTTVFKGLFWETWASQCYFDENMDQFFNSHRIFLSATWSSFEVL